MSNCDLSSGDIRLPLNVVAKHGVECGDHFAHHRHDDDLGLFVSDGEAFGEDFEGRIVSTSAKCRHVENISNRHSTAVDAAMALELSAVEVVRRETDESGDLFSTELAEFRQRSEERKGQVGPTPGMEMSRR